MRKGIWMYQRHWLILKNLKWDCQHVSGEVLEPCAHQVSFATFDTLWERGCGRQNSKMTRNDPHPCIISSPWKWLKPLNMIIIKLYYLAQMTLRKGNYPGWTSPTQVSPWKGLGSPWTGWKCERYLMQGRLPVGGYEDGGATWQEIQMASRSWEWPQLIASEIMKTSVLQPPRTEFGQQPQWAY